ncbi:MAG: UpxY family transcription antiterminator [Haliscomenobacter sp.]|nr:UpxY family transcription antiterminator [Haliscomenobacter sp.]
MSKPSTSINQLQVAEARWFAVYTGFKREKLVRQRLQTRGIESYLPLQRTTRYYTRKIRHVDLPLISCYVFVKIVRQEYVPVLEDPDVLYFVKQRSDLIAIPEREIDILKAVTGEQIEVEVTPIAGSPIPGEEVEIIKGRLFGLKGMLIEQQNNRRVVIELEQLGLALRLQLPVDYIRPTGNRKKVPASSSRLERGGFLDRLGR